MSDEILHRLDRIEMVLAELVAQKQVKEWYSTAEVAKHLHRAEFTVREWCRLGRVLARKRKTGRGNSREWMISRKEMVRIQNEGLLPQAIPYPHLPTDSIHAAR